MFGIGSYFAQRPTIASGEVLGQQLVEANGKNVKEMHCDKQIRIGASGARFGCAVRFKDGETGHMTFEMDREGMIHQAGATPHDKVKRTSDPWGD